MSPLPNTLRIGPYTWTVKCSKKAWAETKPKEGEYGEADPHKYRITLKPKMSLQYERVVLMHEIMHAARFATEQDLDLNKAEESFIELTDGILVAVLQDNPDLLDYLGVGL